MAAQSIPALFADKISCSAFVQSDSVNGNPIEPINKLNNAENTRGRP